MKKKFNDVSVRDQQAADYYRSKEFIDSMRLMLDWFSSYAPYVTVYSKIDPKKQDMPYIEESFLKVQKDFPQFNHIRLAAGGILVDTENNTLRRRLRTAFDGNCMSQPAGSMTIASLWKKKKVSSKNPKPSL